MIYADEKLPTMNWKLDVRTKEYYNELVATGLAWELYPSMPLSWEECLEELEENGDEQSN